MNDESPSYRHIPSPTPAISEKALAEEEEQQIERARNEHERDQKTRTVVGRGLNWIIILIFFIVSAAIITLGWHMLTPEEIHWLSEDQLGDVKTFMLSGALVSLGTTYLRRFLDKQ